jgi:hypothetical protein
VNNPAAFIPDQEVNYLQIIPVIDHPPQDAPGPVIVHGNEQGMNFDNFMQLGEGVQNLMLAYFDVEGNEDVDVDEHNNNLLIDNNDVNDNNHLEDFMDFNIANDLVEPEVAHLQMGFVHTHFFMVPDKEELFSEFSEEGMKL